jgi:hypothetical protein
VAQIFGVECTAPDGTSGGNDRTIPIREAVSGLDFQRAGEDRESDLLDPEAGPACDQADCDVVRQWVGPAGSRSLNIEFLENLDRQCSIVPFKKAIARSRLAASVGSRLME